MHSTYLGQHLELKGSLVKTKQQERQFFQGRHSREPAKRLSTADHQHTSEAAEHSHKQTQAANEKTGGWHNRWLWPWPLPPRGNTFRPA
jgi:hypothetical protein